MLKVAFGIILVPFIIAGFVIALAALVAPFAAIFGVFEAVLFKPSQAEIERRERMKRICEEAQLDQQRRHDQWYRDSLDYK